MLDGLPFPVRVVVVVLGLPAVPFAFGWSVLGRWSRLDREERFAASWGVGLAALAVGEFVAFLTEADQAAFNVAVLGVMLVAAAACQLAARRAGPAVPRSGAWAIALLWLLGYLHLVCIQGLLPQYVGSNWYYDWWMHYDEALVFLRAPDHSVLDTKWGPYTVASRTPLFNLTGAFALSLAGRDFWVFQLADALMGSCFIPAVYLLMRQLFGRRAAVLGCLLASVNLWMLHNAWFTWPKMLAAYYLILGLYFYLRFVRLREADGPLAARSLWFWWACMLLAYMTHPAALVYLAPLLLHGVAVCYRPQRYVPGARDAAVFAALLILLPGLWSFWLSRTFSPEELKAASPVAAMIKAPLAPRDVAEYIGRNLGYSVVPITLLRAVVPPPVQAAFGYPDASPPSFASVYDGLTHFYFSLFTGALTFSLSIFLLAAALKKAGSLLAHGLASHARKLPADAARASATEWTAVWLFVGLGALGAAALHAGLIEWGIAHSACFPSAVVLAALGWGVLARARKPWIAITCSGIVAEFLLMFWSHRCFASDREMMQKYLDPWLANLDYKTSASLDFLCDLVQSRTGPFLYGAVAVQAAVVFLLGWWLFRERWVLPSGLDLSTGATGPAADGEAW